MNKPANTAAHRSTTASRPTAKHQPARAPQTARKAEPSRPTTPKTTPEPDWLRPLSAELPCGESLEYDAEFLLLQRRLEPVPETQYGQFVSQAVEPDWVEIERDCERLLRRSQDVSLLVWLTRALLKLRGCQGLQEGLLRMTRVLERYPDDVHPQLLVEGEQDPQLRANALAALADPDGLLGDIRAQALSTNMMTALTLKELERARVTPHLLDAQARESVHLRLAEIAKREDSPLPLLRECHALAIRLNDWNLATCGDHSADLKPLLQLLGCVVGIADQPKAHTAAPPSLPSTPSEADSPRTDSHMDFPQADEPLSEAGAPMLQADGTSQPVAGDQPFDQGGSDASVNHVMPLLPAQTQDHAATSSSLQAQREHMKQVIWQTCLWFERMEPSSPVGLLLRQAATLVGRPYCEVAQALPPELLARWSSPAAD